jgi:uncharacterized membrane protein
VNKEVFEAQAPHLKGIYTLFGISVLINVLFPIAVLWTLAKRSIATQWAESHYHYLLKSSLWAAGLMLLSAVLMTANLSLGGWMVLPIKLWFAYRVFRGVRALLKQQAI